MTPERLEELRKKAYVMPEIKEFIDEIDRLNVEVAKFHRGEPYMGDLVEGVDYGFTGGNPKLGGWFALRQNEPTHTSSSTESQRILGKLANRFAEIDAMTDEELRAMERPLLHPGFDQGTDKR